MIVVTEGGKPDITIRKSLFNNKLAVQCATCHWIDTYGALPEAQTAAEAHMKNAHDLPAHILPLQSPPEFVSIEDADAWAALQRSLWL